MNPPSYVLPTLPIESVPAAPIEVDKMTDADLDALVERRALALLQEMEARRQKERELAEAEALARIEAQEAWVKGDDEAWPWINIEARALALVSMSFAIPPNGQDAAGVILLHNFLKRVPLALRTFKVIEAYLHASRAFLANVDFDAVPLEHRNLVVKTPYVMLHHLPLSLRNPSNAQAFIGQFRGFLWDVPLQHRTKDVCVAALKLGRGLLDDVPPTLRLSPDFMGACTQAGVSF